MTGPVQTVPRTVPSTFKLSLVLALLGTFAPFSTDMYLAAFPAMAADMNTDIETVQMTLAVFFFGLALGQLLYGPLSDRLGRKIPLYGGLVIYILATALMIFVRDIGGFLTLRFMQAIGGCSGMIIGRAVVRDSYDLAGAAKVFTILMAVQSVGPVVAPVLGAYFTKVSGWGSNFVFMTALGLLSLAAVRFGLQETHPEERRVRQGLAASLASFRTVFRRPVFRWISLAGAFGGGAIFAFISGSPSLLMGKYGFDEAQYGWTFASFSIVMALASQTNYILLKHFSSLEIMRGTLAWMCAASFSVTVFCEISGLPGIGLLLFLILLSFAPFPLAIANSVAVAMQDCGRQAGSASSVLGVLQFAAAGAVSSGLSAVSETVAMPITFMIFLASGAALVCLFFGIRAAGAVSPDPERPDRDA
ncbi:MAG: multidrug effflux MFS transporter [Deltaproteobacteria bacterium]|jgi:DHA1 family bicyclomycin/chloramphenicol resistance-like MFS transporter|nr:multidrug effflux MFS transporter [Deltaproteobacteria bacterium]